MTLRERNVLDPSGAPPPEQPLPTRRLPVPWVAGAVLGLSVLAFLADQIPGPDGQGHMATELLALYGPLVTAGQWWRILSVVFVHANILHIGFNMWVVVTFGFMFERVVRAGRMAVISLVTAIGASAFSLHFDYAHVMVGASGMILGWIGAMLPIATQQGRRQIGMWVLQIAVLSLLPGVSWSAHLGGFLFGLPCGLALRSGRRFWLIAPLLVAAAVALAYVAGIHPPAGARLAP